MQSHLASHWSSARRQTSHPDATPGVEPHLRRPVPTLAKPVARKLGGWVPAAPGRTSRTMPRSTPRVVKTPSISPVSGAGPASDGTRVGQEGHSQGCGSYWTIPSARVLLRRFRTECLPPPNSREEPSPQRSAASRGIPGHFGTPWLSSRAVPSTLPQREAGHQAANPARNASWERYQGFGPRRARNGPSRYESTSPGDRENGDLFRRPSAQEPRVRSDDQRTKVD